MKRTVTFLSFLFFICLIVHAQPAEPLAGRVILQLQPKASMATVWEQLHQKRTDALRPHRYETLSSSFNIHLLHFDTLRTDVSAILSQLQQLPNVVAAQPDYRLHSRQEPNDPDYIRQWGADRIGTARVWDYTTGGVTAQGDEIVVAIVDFGFDIQHEDLAENIWYNPGEVPGDNIDNDNNGYVDDMVGWNFVNDSNQHPRDSHGTSVAGIIGAVGNNGRGVTGINWNIKMMPFSVQSVSHIVAAYDYIIAQRKRYNETKGIQGAFVVATNLSLGIDQLFCADQPVWGQMYDLLGEVGILTGAGTANQSLDVDKVGDMPTSCPSEFLISCLNTNIQDVKFSRSAYGAASIDLGAPGDGSYSTKIDDRYGSFNDNSAAAPHLTGAIALLYSLPCMEIGTEALSYPQETALAVRRAIVNGVDTLLSLQNITTTGGRLNVARSLELMQDFCTTTTGELEVLRVFPNPAREQVVIEYESPDFESYQLLIYNAIGQMMFHRVITPPRFLAKRQPVDIHNWTSGVYIVAIQREDKRVWAKFIIQ